MEPPEPRRDSKVKELILEIKSLPQSAFPEHLSERLKGFEERDKEREEQRRLLVQQLDECSKSITPTALLVLPPNVEHSAGDGSKSPRRLVSLSPRSQQQQHSTDTEESVVIVAEGEMGVLVGSPRAQLPGLSPRKGGDSLIKAGEENPVESERNTKAVLSPIQGNTAQSDKIESTQPPKRGSRSLNPTKDDQPSSRKVSDGAIPFSASSTSRRRSSLDEVAKAARAEGKGRDLHAAMMAGTTNGAKSVTGEGVPPQGENKSPRQSLSTTTSLPSAAERRVSNPSRRKSSTQELAEATRRQSVKQMYADMLAGSSGGDTVSSSAVTSG